MVELYNYLTFGRIGNELAIILGKSGSFLTTNSEGKIAMFEPLEFFKLPHPMRAEEISHWAKTEGYETMMQKIDELCKEHGLRFGKKPELEGEG